MKKADKHNIAAAIRAGNLPAYQRQRYPAIPDGEIVRFTSEDFSNVDFDKFAMGFLCLIIACLMAPSIYTGSRFISRTRQFAM